MNKLAWMAALSAVIGFGFGCSSSNTPDASQGVADAPPSTIDAMGDTDAGAASNGGFMTPTATTVAYDSMGNKVGDANWDCLGTSSGDVASAAALDVTGTVTDFVHNMQHPAGATVTAYKGIDFSAPAGSSATGTTDASGAYSLTLPAGVTRVAFSVTGGGGDAGVGLFPTYQIHNYFNGKMMGMDAGAGGATENLNSLTSDDVTTLALIPLGGSKPTPNTGLIAGKVYDCDGNVVANAIATVSSTSGSPDHLPGAQSFYFNGSAPLPQNAAMATDKSGLFVILNINAASDGSTVGYIQVWGFKAGQNPATDKMTLLSEIKTPVLQNALITTGSVPLQTP